MSGNMSKNESENYSQTQTGISGDQSPYLKDMWGQAQDWVNNNQGNWDQMLQGLQPGVQQAGQQSQGQYGRNMGGASDAYQQQLGGGVYGQAYGDRGIGNVLGESMMNSLNNPSAMQDINSMIMGGSGNNYADAMKDQYIQDASRAQQMMLANTDARAAASGMSGGSRHGMQQGMGNEAITKNLQSNLAQTGFNTFDKDLDRKLNIAQQADQGTLARQGMLQNMMGQQNAASTGALGNLGMMNQQAAGGMDMNNQFNQNMMGNMAQGQQPLSWLNSMIGGPVMSSSGQSQGSASGMSMGGGLK